MRLSRRRTVATALAALPLLAVLSACGSTVPLTSTGTAAGADGLSVESGSGDGTVAGGSSAAGAAGTTGGSAAGGATGAGSAGGVGTSGTGGSGAGAGSAAGSSGAGGSTSGGGTTGTTGTAPGRGGSGTVTASGPVAPAPVNVAKTGPGWDEKSVYIGVTTQKDAEAAFGAAGFKGVTPGDTEKQAQAVADSVNARGGVLGRSVKLVFRDLPTVSTAVDPTAAGNATCAFFTQDRPVIAVVNIVTLMDGPNFRTCLAKGKVTLFSAAVKAVDNGVTDALNPYFVQTAGVSWDALAPTMVRSLKAQGYFGGWDVRAGKPGSGTAKVGIVAAGDDVGTRVAKTVKRALNDGGIKDVFIYQYADVTQGQNNSVLSFAGKGVTHVIVTDVELLAFMNSANGQGYRPRYGVSSYNAPTTNLEGFAPGGQLNGALGVGWARGLDVNDANDPGNTTAGAKACAATQAKAGQQFRGKRLSLVLSQALCDTIGLTVQSATAGGGFTGPQLAAGRQRLGSAFSSAVGFTTALTATKPFIPGAVRGTAFNPGCGCFRYTTGLVGL